MLAAIGFEDQALIVADKVGDKWSDRLLTPKLALAELARSEESPKRLFGLGGFDAQLHCSFECLFVIAARAAFGCRRLRTAPHPHVPLRERQSGVSGKRGS